MLDLHRFHKPLALVTLVVVTNLPSICLTQDKSEPSTRHSSDNPLVLEEVIVTATRRAADVRTVPLSVHVLTEDELTRLGATGFADYARTVAGLSFTDGGTGGENQTIRGITTNSWFEPTQAGTAIYLDEVPITRAGGGVGPPYNPDPLLVDIKRIEVLRGPQGTLFGAGAMGGAIRIITNKPDLSEKAGFVDALVTSTQDGELGYGLHGMFNAPLNDGRAGLRMVAYQQDLGGYIDNLSSGEKDVNNRKITGVRVAGTVLLSDHVSLYGRIAYQDRRVMA